MKFPGARTCPGGRKLKWKNPPCGGLGFIPSTATALLPLATALLGGGGRGGEIITTLPTTARTEELGAEIIVAHITRAVRREAEAHRRITIHHFELPTFYHILKFAYRVPNKITSKLMKAKMSRPVIFIYLTCFALCALIIT